MAETTPQTIDEWVAYIHDWAHRKGFYGDACAPPCVHSSGSRAASLMLIVTELAEACEADRTGDMVEFCEEIADAVIRLFDLAGAEGIQLSVHIAEKMRRNENRLYKHGKRY